MSIHTAKLPSAAWHDWAHNSLYVCKAVVSWHLGTTISPMKIGNCILFQSIQTATNENQSNKSNANQALCQMFWVCYNVVLQYKKYSHIFELHTFFGFFQKFLLHYHRQVIEFAISWKVTSTIIREIVKVSEILKLSHKHTPQERLHTSFPISRRSSLSVTHGLTAGRMRDWRTI